MSEDKEITSLVVSVVTPGVDQDTAFEEHEYDNPNERSHIV